MFEEDTFMTVTLKRPWEAIDGSKPKGQGTTKIPAGTHEVERIPCPHGYDCNWLVLKGTLIGASEGSWRQWGDDGAIVVDPSDPNYGKPIDWGEFEVVIQD